MAERERSHTGKKLLEFSVVKNPDFERPLWKEKTASQLSKEQLANIHVLMRELGIDDEDYNAIKSP